MVMTPSADSINAGCKMPEYADLVYEIPQLFFINNVMPAQAGISQAERPAFTNPR
jgi:hypothetical protein